MLISYSIDLKLKQIFFLKNNLYSIIITYLKKYLQTIQVNYYPRARVKEYISFAPACFKIFAACLNVDPVV